MNNVYISPESVSLKANTPNNAHIEMIATTDDEQTDDNKQDTDSSVSPEPLKRVKHFALNSNHNNSKKCKTAMGTYNELQNESMYSLKDNESIYDFDNSEHQNDENPEGWPIFEPLSGPYPLSVYKKDYKQLKNEILSGLVVSFAQVPEAVAFSFLAGVDPFIGLHAAWIVGLITSLFGGRCAEISGATGATAAVLGLY